MNVYTLELARIPLTTLKVLMRLARTLLRDKPEQTNAVIEASAAALDEVLEGILEELIRRQIARSGQLSAPMASFDYAVDALWIALRNQLERHRVFTNEALDQLPPELAQAGQIEPLRERAKQAQLVWDRLFASEGTSFTRSKMLEQSESMAVLLQLLHKEDLRPVLEGVVGEAEVALLYAVQKHYEDLVDSRLRKSRHPNLNQLRNKLRWAIIAYVNAVHSLAKLDDPSTHELVLDALQPILTLRGLISRSASGEALEEGLEDFVDAGLPEEELGEGDDASEPAADEDEVPETDAELESEGAGEAEEEAEQPAA